MSAYVLLEDGTRFDGDAVGPPGPVTGEVAVEAGAVFEQDVAAHAALSAERRSR